MKAMMLDYSGTAAVLMIGMITCVALAPRLKGAVFSLAGLFILAADSKLFGAQLSSLALIERLGYREQLGSHLDIWHYGWRALPVLLTAACAWHLWKRLRSLLPIGRNTGRSIAS